MTFVVSEAPRTPSEQIAAATADPGFGRYFVDHLARATWTAASGWTDRVLAPMGEVPVHPGMAALHYGQEIFEGLKAYRHPDGSVWLFRPEMNAARFARSAQRMSMPALEEQDFLDAVTTLVAENQEWVPTPVAGESLYIRPFMFGSETLIGVRDAHEYTFMVIASPACPFYADPLRLWVSEMYSRSMVGGTGEAKCAGNYATALAGEAEAAHNGCDQVLWLDSATRSLVEEGGTMNILAITADRELVTPALTGTILPGVTRDSLLVLAESHGLTPVERQVPLAWLVEGIRTGRVTEVLACGTAAVVSPIVSIASDEFDVEVGDGTPGTRTLELRDHLTGIQFGTRPDEHGWTRRVTG